VRNYFRTGTYSYGTAHLFIAFSVVFACQRIRAAVWPAPEIKAQIEIPIGCSIRAKAVPLPAFYSPFVAPVAVLVYWNNGATINFVAHTSNVKCGSDKNFFIVPHPNTNAHTITHEVGQDWRPNAFPFGLLGLLRTAWLWQFLQFIFISRAAQTVGYA